MANKVTHKDIILFNELYLKLKTYAAVARETGFSASTVSKYIDHNYKSIEEKANLKILFDQAIAPLTSQQISDFKLIKGHWGLTCELSKEEREELEQLHAEV